MTDLQNLYRSLFYMVILCVLMVGVLFIYLYMSFLLNELNAFESISSTLDFTNLK